MHSILAIFFLLGTFTQVTLSDPPGVLTVTMDSALLPANGKLESVQIKQGNKECKDALIPTENPMQFSIDWNGCPRKEMYDDMLHDIEMRIRLSGGNGVVIKLGEYSHGLYKHLFVGGKAKIFLDGTHPRLVYVEDPSGITFKPPGTLTFDVGFSQRAIKSLDHVEIKHLDKAMRGCKAHIFDNTKFSVDLAKCNVHHAKDIVDLGIEIHLTLSSNEKKGRLSAPLYLLTGEEDSENLLQKFYGGGEAKIVFHPSKSPEITYQQQKIGSNEPNTPKHHASASAASSSHHGPEAKHKTAGWKGETKILFVAPNKVKRKQIAVPDPERENHFVVADVKDIKVVSEGEHKLMLHKDGEDGLECPVKIVENFWQEDQDGADLDEHEERTGGHAWLQVEWEKCSEKVKTPEDLAGMVLHIFYSDSAGKMGPKEIRCRLKSRLLEKFFDGDMFYVGQKQNGVYHMDSMVGR